MDLPASEWIEAIADARDQTVEELVGSLERVQGAVDDLPDPGTKPVAWSRVARTLEHLRSIDEYNSDDGATGVEVRLRTSAGLELHALCFEPLGEGRVVLARLVIPGEPHEGVPLKLFMTGALPESSFVTLDAFELAMDRYDAGDEAGMYVFPILQARVEREPTLH